MGWKSTKIISREEALSLLGAYVFISSNDDISSLLGYILGDDPKLPYYGYNFRVEDEVELDDED